MNNDRYCLPSGRKVDLIRLHLDHTYSGLLEGTPETATPVVLKHLRGFVERILSPGKPLVIRDPGVVPLPRFRLVAELESCKAVKTVDPDYSSRLFACWFADDISGSISDLLQPVLADIDWEADAEDYDIMSF